MTDEKFSFIEDVKEKRSTGNSVRYRKGKGGSRVTLSQDLMTNKEIEAKHGPVEGWNLRRPMLWKAFKSMPEDLQREYFGNMYSFGGTDQKIAVMFNVSLQSVNVVKSQIGFSAVGNGKEVAGKWADFIKGTMIDIPQNVQHETDDILEAVNYKTFKAWNSDQQKTYLLAIQERFQAPSVALCKLFNITESMVYFLNKKLGIEPLRHRTRRLNWAEESWEAFIAPVLKERELAEKANSKSDPVIFETPKEEYCRPMKWSEIKLMPYSDKKSYFEYLIRCFHASYCGIGRMAGVDPTRIRKVCSALGVKGWNELVGHKRCRVDDEIWEDWIKSFEKDEEEEMADIWEEDTNMFGNAMKELETAQKELNDKLLMDGFVGADSFIAKVRPDAIPEEMKSTVTKYCEHDEIATEELYTRLADIRKEASSTAKLLNFSMTLQVHSWDELHEVLKNLPFPEGQPINLHTYNTL